MYSTLYQFAQSIESDNPLDDLSHHFDQIVALYHLVGGRSDMDIYAIKENDTFGFSLLLETEESAKSLNGILQNNHFSVFGKTLNCVSKLEKANCLSVHFNT